MAKEIKTAEELESLFESLVRANHPTAAGRIVVILRSEAGASNWTASHSGQPPEIVAAIDRILPEMQARYELNPPGRA